MDAALRLASSPSFVSFSPEHGKRADAIVKNMLLHSREGSGEHRPVDINALVEESLNLAWHGARAEKQGFNITLERSLDPTAGEADVFPQDITRVLLNLISNGFYAASKRKAEANGEGYEPTLAASTKNLGDRVEIGIRDNGTGILPDVKEKMFNPFFTTKPAGEGRDWAFPSATTLSSSSIAGLSMLSRPADDLKHVGSSCLLRERFAQLFEQARVFDGDDSLGSEIFE
jgi:signal transduction histidine kinase